MDGLYKSIARSALPGVIMHPSHQHSSTTLNHSTMPSSENPTSPPPAYIHESANTGATSSTLSSGSAHSQINMYPAEGSVPNSSGSSYEIYSTGQPNVNPSQLVHTTDSCTIGGTSDTANVQLVAKLEKVIASFKNDDAGQSKEEKLVTRLENIIDRMGDTNVSKVRRDTRKPIKFKDALGRKFSFPYHRCETWAGMEELIKQAFVHIDVIVSHVNQGRYDLMNAAGEVILPEVWEDHVEPGWAISMSMWPIPDAQKPRGPPPPPVHVIVDRLPGPPPGPPKEAPIYCPRHAHMYGDDASSVYSRKKKGIRGFWEKVKGVFKKKRTANYDSDDSDSICD